MENIGISAGIVVGLGVLALVIIGAWACLPMLASDRRRSRHGRRMHPAEAEIIAISRRAEQAIFDEVMRRTDRHGRGNDTWENWR